MRILPKPLNHTKPLNPQTLKPPNPDHPKPLNPYTPKPVNPQTPRPTRPRFDLNIQVRIMLDTVTLMREINPDYKFLPEVFWSLGVYGFRGLGSRV